MDSMRLKTFKEICPLYDITGVHELVRTAEIMGESQLAGEIVLDKSGANDVVPKKYIPKILEYARSISVSWADTHETLLDLKEIFTP
jgi:hypothetical protein